MKEITALERVLHKVDEKTRPMLAPVRRMKLRDNDFTIISNNCWGGVCYEYFGLQKKSPTVGMYFFADEYIRFLSDMKRYLSTHISFISASESRYADELAKRDQMNIPVGVLDDVEIVMLHYKDKAVAEEKWCRRVERINWNNLIYKFSYMNGCKDSHIHEFESLATKGGVKHFEFVSHPFPEYSDAYVIEPGEDGQIANDTFYWNKYCDVVDILNR